MTFLERAPRTVLGPLDHVSMTERYIATLKVGQDVANKIAMNTCGYSFAFQTLGYFFYEYPTDEERALREAREYLYEFAYQKIWSKLSKKDRDVVYAIAVTPGRQIADIRKKLHFTNNQLNPYRDRLIKEGIIIGDAIGHVDWALPFFDAFAKKQMGK